MSCRKWLVRGLVFTVAGGLVCAGWAYQRWTSPTVVRQQVIGHLQALFPHAVVALESARLRLLGGIALNELRLVRRDDATRTDFAYIPSARLYHDKEMLLEGKLALRKVELYRPRFRLIREKDGTWNWADLFAPSEGRAALPTLVIDDGTFLLVDRRGAAGLPALEIGHVQLTVINDPATTVTFSGTGRSDVLGQVELRGSWRRDTRRASVSVQAVGVPVNAALARRLCGTYPEADFTGLLLEGIADVQASVHYRGGAPQPVRYEVACRLTHGKLVHPKIPVPLDGLELSAHCANGSLLVKKLTASAGPAQVTAAGEAHLPAVAQDFSGTVTVTHLPVTAELCQRLPPFVGKVYDALRPTGCVSVTADFGRQAGTWTRRHFRLRPEGAAVCYDRFPYPVRQVTGTVDMDMADGNVQIDAAGYGGLQPVTLKGHWKGVGKAADVALDLHAAGVPLDEPLIRALPSAPTDVQKLARSFHPAGRADVVAHIRHAPGGATYANTYEAHFHEASTKWTGFPYPLENVSGTLTVYPDHWEFRDFAGTHRGADVRVSGQSFPRDPAGPAGEAHVIVEIAGRGVAIDADLREALQPMPGLARAWDSFSPGGRLSFWAKVDRLPGRPQDVDVAVDVHGCSVRPVFFPYALEDLSGLFHYKGNQLHVSRVRANHGASNLTIDDVTVTIFPRGAYYAVFKDVRADPVIPDPAFIEALPRALRVGLEAVNLQDRVTVRADVVKVSQAETPGTPPDVYWEGKVELERARLQLGLPLTDVTGALACIGRYDGRQMVGLVGDAELSRATALKQPFENVHAHYYIKEGAPNVLVVDSLNAPLYGGNISGQARLDFSKPLRYDVNLTASQIDLRQLGRHNLGAVSELGGLAWGRLSLSGQGGGADGLEGSGSFHVPRGKLYNLPFLDDLLKILGLRSPDRTTFDEAHADVSIHGRRLRIDHLDLWGSVLSLTGSGALNLDGTDTALDFYPSWGPMGKLLPKEVPDFSKNLFKIEIRGKVGGRRDELHFTKKPLPVLVDPLLQLRARVLKGEPR
jgi:hypothetical protein